MDNGDRMGGMDRIKKREGRRAEGESSVTFEGDAVANHWNTVADRCRFLAGMFGRSRNRIALKRF